MHQLRAGHAGEHLARQVGGAADARGGEVELAWVGPCVVDQFRHRLHRQVGIDHQQEGIVGHVADRRQVGHRVEARRFEQAGRDGVRPERGHQEGISVRRGLGGELGGHHAARTGLVLDDHRLAEDRLHALGDGAADDVGVPARSKAHQDADGFVGEGGLGVGRQGEGGGEEQQGSELAFHGGFPLMVLCREFEQSLCHRPPVSGRRVAGKDTTRGSARRSSAARPACG